MQSLLIKLGMLTATMAVVFWIGWTVPVQPDRAVVATTGASQQHATTAEVEAAGSSGAVSFAPPPRSAVQERPRRLPGKLDLNRVTAAELESLPGIGAALASRIVEYRQTTGGFQTVEQLRLVKGIGPKKFDRVRGLVEVTPMPKSKRKDSETT
jgi:competence protein ComEA